MIKIKRVNIIHLNENGKRIAESTFTPHKGLEPSCEEEKDVFKACLTVILDALKIPSKDLKIRKKHMDNAIINITTNKGKYYF